MSGAMWAEEAQLEVHSSAWSRPISIMVGGVGVLAPRGITK